MNPPYNVLNPPKRCAAGHPLGTEPGCHWCGARTRAGTPCQCPAMRGRRRCALHGGKSTGARTPEGRERARMANYRHGEYTKEAKAERRRQAEILRLARECLAEIIKASREV